MSANRAASIPQNGHARGDRPAQINGHAAAIAVEDRPRPLHRLRTVRQQQGITLRTVSRHLGIDVRTLRRQEDECSDLRLSELFNWQKTLDVPLAELLVDPGTPLSSPVLERAKLVRLMKTAMAIQQQATTPAIERLGKTLCDQLVELMPELAGVSSWHSVGQRRSLEDFGRIVERAIADDVFRSPSVDFAD